MSFKVRALEIDVSTSGGPYGASFRFADGLNIIHAANSRGKSTSLTSLMWALGMEGVLSPLSRAALQAVVTKELEGPDRTRHEVKSSHVLIEIENHRNEAITVVRPIHGTRSSDLVSVYSGRILDGQKLSSTRADYYTRVEGSASREKGYLRFLAAFAGLELPMVARYDGSECPLYLQTIFPLHYVEQKQGWSRIQALTPVQYQIRDVQKRALEFVLSLDIYNLQKKRAELIAARQQAQARWTVAVRAIKNAAARINGIARGLEDAPSEQADKRPSYDVIVKATTWYNLPNYVRHLREQLDKIDAEALPAREKTDFATQRSLKSLDDKLAKARLQVRMAIDKTLTLRSEEDSISLRIRTLTEDRKRSLDAQRLMNLGSPEEAYLNIATCPVCQQSVADSILPQQFTGNVMSIGDNVNFIDSQLVAFRTVLPTTQASSNIAERELSDIRDITTDLEAQIGEIRRSLTDGSSPTIAMLRERVRVEARYEIVSTIQDELLEMYDSVGEIYDEYAEIQSQLKSLPKGELSFADLKTLEALRLRFREQLSAYGFSSVPPSSINISYENYRPVSGDFDLAPQVSASDNVRSIWAYLLSLLELAASENLPNHLGLLIFDEPRQQEIETSSLRALLERAASSLERNQQVIFASSQENLNEQIRGLPIKVIGLTNAHDYLLQPKETQHPLLTNMYDVGG